MPEYGVVTGMSVSFLCLKWRKGEAQRGMKDYQKVYFLIYTCILIFFVFSNHVLETSSIF